MRLIKAIAVSCSVGMPFFVVAAIMSDKYGNAISIACVLAGWVAGLMAGLKLSKS